MDCIPPPSLVGETILDLFSKGPYEELPVAALARGLVLALGYSEEDAVTALKAAYSEGLIELDAVPLEDLHEEARTPTIAGPLGRPLTVARLMRDTELPSPPTDCDEHLGPGEKLVAVPFEVRPDRGGLPAVLAPLAEASP